MARMLIKKSVARIQEEAMQTTLKRALGKWNLLSLGIGCIIGAGIFSITGNAIADHAGPAILISFVIAGIACAFAGLCYAELASILPVSGSAYTYTYATLGEVFAWIMGWLLLLEYGLAGSTVAVSWSGYLVSMLGDFGIHIPAQWANPMLGGAVKMPDGSMIDPIFNLPAAGIVLAVTALLVLGIQESAKVNNVIVFLKVAVLLAFIGFGLFHINFDNFSPFIPDATNDPNHPDQYGWNGVLRAASIIFFAYVGFEAVSTAAAEAKDPQKDMPFGIIGSLMVCTVLYMLVSIVLIGLIHYSELGVPDPLAIAVDQMNMGWFSFFIKMGAILGLSSVVLVLLYGQTRIFYIMSRDGLLPQAFAKTHPKYHTPYINTLTVGIAVAVAAGLTPIKVLGDLVSLGTLAAFAMVCLTVLYLRRTQPDLPRPFRTPFVPFVPLIGIAICAYLISTMPLSTFIQLKWYFLVGALIYLFYGMKHSRLAQELKALPADEVFVKGKHEKPVD